MLNNAFLLIPHCTPWAWCAPTATEHGKVCMRVAHLTALCWVSWFMKTDPKRKVEMSDIIIDSLYKLSLLFQMRRLYIMRFCFCSRKAETSLCSSVKSFFLLCKSKNVFANVRRSRLPAVKGVHGCIVKNQSYSVFLFFWCHIFCFYPLPGFGH